MKDKKNMAGIIGLIAMGVGFAASIVETWSNDKKIEEEIDARVQEKFKELSNEES